MNAKVIIENGVTSIELFSENEFEKDICDKLYNSDSILTGSAKVEKQYGVIKSAKLYLTLTDKI